MRLIIQLQKICPEVCIVFDRIQKKHVVTDDLRLLLCKISKKYYYRLFTQL